MLTYGGFALLLAGLFFMFGGASWLVKSRRKARRIKRRAPVLAALGVMMLTAALLLGPAESYIGL